MTIYMPDDLAAEVKDKLGDTNISAICQRALREELDRAEAAAQIDEEGYERVQVYDPKRERDVAFQGKEIASDYDTEQTAWVTEKGNIVVADSNSMEIFGDWDGVAEPEGQWPSQNLMVQIAEALGEKYVEELDI